MLTRCITELVSDAQQNRRRARRLGVARSRHAHIPLSPRVVPRGSAQLQPQLGRQMLMLIGVECSGVYGLGVSAMGREVARAPLAARRRSPSGSHHLGLGVRGSLEQRKRSQGT
eukprot:975158-Rhodomonas_salina.2